MKAGYKYNNIQLRQIQDHWQEFAGKYNADYTHATGSSGKAFSGVSRQNDIDKFKLVIPYKKDKEIEISFSDIHPLKATYKFKRPIPFHFLIFPESLIEKINKLLGQQDIILEHDEFDRKFILQGDNEGYIKSFLDDKIVGYLNKQQISNFKLEFTAEYDFLEITLFLELLDKKNLEELVDFLMYSIDRII